MRAPQRYCYVPKVKVDIKRRSTSRFLRRLRRALGRWRVTTTVLNFTECEESTCEQYIRDGFEKKVLENGAEKFGSGKTQTAGSFTRIDDVHSSLHEGKRKKR